MTTKQLFLILIAGLVVSCSGGDKKTIGSSGSFSPPGSEFNLTPNLSTAALGALVSAQSFPLSQRDLLFQDPQLIEVLERVSRGQSVGSLQTGVREDFEWMLIREGDLYLLLTTSGNHFLLEAWRANPFHYSRLLARSAMVDVLNKSRAGILNYVFRSDCSQTMLASFFESDRKNYRMELGNGAPCDGLSFYRETEIPELINRLRNLEELGSSKLPLRPQLENFYEIL